jgi:hypothetical protein
MSIHEHDGGEPATVGDPLLGDPLRGETERHQDSKPGSARKHNRVRSVPRVASVVASLVEGNPGLS